MSEQPGNLLTLPVNKAVNPTDTTRPSIISHWTRGVTRRQSGAFLYRSVSYRLCVCVCVKMRVGEEE